MLHGKGNQNIKIGNTKKFKFLACPGTTDSKNLFRLMAQFSDRPYDSILGLDPFVSGPNRTVLPSREHLFTPKIVCLKLAKTNFGVKYDITPPLVSPHMICSLCYVSLLRHFRLRSSVRNPVF